MMQDRDMLIVLFHLSVGSIVSDHEWLWKAIPAF